MRRRPYTFEGGDHPLRNLHWRRAGVVVQLSLGSESREWAFQQ